MNLFYNLEGVGNVLLGQLTTEKPAYTIAEKHQDVVLIRDEKSNEVVGFNLFNATNYVEMDANGPVKLTEELVSKVQQAFDQCGVNFKLEVDLTPKFVVGYVTAKEKHPNADKLNICTVDVGAETLQIVCGAANVDADQKVVVAKVGAVMPSGMVIRDAELRGVPSSGMICSESELNLPNAQKDVGILVLDADAVIGEEFPVQ